MNFSETYLISFRYMLWRNQSGICPPFFYVIIAEKDKLKSLKDFFGLKMKNSVGPLVLQEQVHTVNCWINVKNLSYCFCFFSAMPWRPALTAPKKGCFAYSKWASFGSNKKMFDLCENLVSVWNRKVEASISFFVASCLSMNVLPFLKLKNQWKSGLEIFLLALSWSSQSHA